MSNPIIRFTLLADPPPAAGGRLTAESFARMMKALLPPGRLWSVLFDDLLSKLFLACGDELVRVDEQIRNLERETNPGTAVDYLPEWEASFGLPSTGTLEQRQARADAADKRRPRFRAVDFQQALGPWLGQSAEDVVVIVRTHAEAVAMGDEREIFRFFIYRDPDAPGTPDIARAQAIVDAMKPSHTLGQVIQSVGFRCDDPNSLTDRDLLGV